MPGLLEQLQGRMPRPMPNPFEQDRRVGAQFNAAGQRLMSPTIPNFGGQFDQAGKQFQAGLNPLTMFGSALNLPQPQLPPSETEQLINDMAEGKVDLDSIFGNLAGYSPSPTPSMGAPLADMTRAASPEGFPGVPNAPQFVHNPADYQDDLTGPSTRVAGSAPAGASPEVQDICAILARLANRPKFPEPKPLPEPNGIDGVGGTMLPREMRGLTADVDTRPWLRTKQSGRSHLETAQRDMSGPPDAGHMVGGQWFPGPAKTRDESIMEQKANELTGVIPMLQAKGYQFREDAPEGTPGVGLMSGGFMAAPPPSPGQPPVRSIHDLRRMARENQAAKPTGMFNPILEALGVVADAPNELTPHEQARVAAYNESLEARAAREAEGRKFVQQRAQGKALARDMRMNGVSPLLSALGVFEEGEGGPPNPGLALVAPGLYQAQATGWEAARDQQRLDQERERLVQRDKESDRRFDKTVSIEERRDANEERRHQARMEEERQNNPFRDMSPDTAEDLKVKAAGGSDQDLIDRDIATATLTPRVERTLNERYNSFEPWEFPFTDVPMNPFYGGLAIGGGDRRGHVNTEFVKAMVKEGYPPALIQQFLEKTGRSRGVGRRYSP